MHPSVTSHGSGTSKGTGTGVIQRNTTNKHIRTLSRSEISHDIDTLIAEDQYHHTHTHTHTHTSSSTSSADADNTNKKSAVSRYLPQCQQLIVDVLHSERSNEFIYQQTTQNTQIYYKPKTLSSLAEFKSIGIVHASPISIVDTLCDLSVKTVYDELFDSGEFVEDVNDVITLQHLKYWAPFPFSPRDFCILAHRCRLVDNTIILGAVSIEHDLCPANQLNGNKKYIRAYMKGGYIIRPYANTPPATTQGQTVNHKDVNVSGSDVNHMNAPSSIVTYIGMCDIKMSLPEVLKEKLLFRQSLQVALMKQVCERTVTHTKLKELQRLNTLLPVYTLEGEPLINQSSAIMSTQRHTEGEKDEDNTLNVNESIIHNRIISNSSSSVSTTASPSQLGMDHTERTEVEVDGDTETDVDMETDTDVDVIDREIESTPSGRVMNSSSILMSGYLFKRGTKLRMFSRRFFQLLQYGDKSIKLQYRLTHYDNDIRGVMVLDDVFTVQQLSEKQFAIILQNERARLVLKADNPFIAQQWYQHLSMLMIQPKDVHTHTPAPSVQQRRSEGSGNNALHVSVLPLTQSTSTDRAVQADADLILTDHTPEEGMVNKCHVASLNGNNQSTWLLLLTLLTLMFVLHNSEQTKLNLILQLLSMVGAAVTSEALLSPPEGLTIRLSVVAMFLTSLVCATLVAPIAQFLVLLHIFLNICRTLAFL